MAELIDLDDLLSLQEAIDHSELSKGRLYQIREEVGVSIKGNWFYSRSKLDAYKAREKRKGGRPAGSKINDLIPSPVIRAAA